ncbi:hypothetical protein ACFQ2B_36540 [Streptomyces stramineus]|uniref:Uncharacterized protein n=1 Tax=Streptomyces stramineus TaxID=173861 RepID=A0ABP3J6R7_9ACTN
MSSAPACGEFLDAGAGFSGLFADVTFAGIDVLQEGLALRVICNGMITGNPDGPTCPHSTLYIPQPAKPATGPRF